jgi:hypothetical protein
MKVNFIRKPTTQELIPQHQFVIEKAVLIDQNLFNQFIQDPLQDYEFINKHKELMCRDKLDVFHCIFVTTNECDFGILVESEGYGYARYAAYLPKVLIHSN